MKKYYLLMLLFFGFQAIQAQYTQIPDPNFEQALIDYEYDDILDGKVLTANISGINYLNLYSQNISDLSGIQDFVDLEILYCYGNQLTTLDVSGLTNLNNFDCSYNQITNLNVSGLTNLQTLNCQQNQLANLNLSGLTNLNQLYCQGNQLSTLDLRGLIFLGYLDCYENPNLSCISVDDVKYPGFSSNKDSFTRYSLDCSIPPVYTLIPDSYFEQELINNGYDEIFDGRVITDNISSVTYLYLAYKNISDLTGIQDFVNLEALYCNNNQLTSLDLSGLTNLQNLHCKSNQLSTLDLRGVTNLFEMYSNDNPNLSCISVNNVEQAQQNGSWSKDSFTQYSLDCSIPSAYTLIPDPIFEQALIGYGHDDILDGKVLTANISGITYLNIGYSTIGDLTGIQDFVSLSTLLCNNNLLTNINVSGLANLQTLYCNGNQLTNLDVSGLINLNVLNCAGNQITNLNISGLTNLNQLVCNSNLLTNLNLNGLTNLNLLYCQGNQLSALDLRGISNLNIMFCYANPNLSCISVDDVEQANYNVENYEWQKDESTTFSLDCTITPSYTLIPDPNFEQFLIINGQDDIMDGRALTSNFVGVTYLDASNRNINDLTGIQDFVNLQTLFCHENQLTNLDVSGLTNLQFLYCTNNQLYSLDLRGLTSLSSLNSTSNPNLSCISVNNISQFNQNNNFIKDSFTNYSLDCGPNPPTANAQSFCGSTTANSLVPAISSSIKWYSSSTSTTALLASDAISTGTYYVSQIVNDVEGYRAAVPITVNQSVVSPIENQVVCNNSNIDAILFNTISNVQTICGLAYEGESVTLTAPAGSVITEITFASYGAPYGSCGDFTISESCHAINSMDIVSSLAIGKNSVTIPASNDVFGNPCGEYGYTLLIQATTASVSTYNWTNDTPSIGLSESGTGSINSFIATNTSTIPVVATISVVKSDSNGCQSDPRSFTLTVNPILEPTFTQVEAICSGASIAALPTTSENGITGTWSPELNNEATTEYTFTPADGQCATTATMTITVNPTVEPMFTQVEAICSGASNAALPTISDNGISGTWSPELNNEATTEYTFTPADGQCATTATMTITVNPTTSSTETVTACDSYTWLVNDQTYTESGTYTATGTNAAGCTDTKTLVLTINSTPLVDVIAPPSTCEGLVQIILTNVTASEGSVSLWTATNGGTIDGGNDNPFRVNISRAGTYMLTVTNGGCVASDFVTAVYNPIVEPTFTSVAPICAGETLAELPTISNNGILGTWSPALNNEATTEYTFTPENGQCATTATMTITVDQCIQVFCSGATVSSLTPSGAGIVWYSTDLTKTPLLATAILSTKTYYYTQTVGGVVSSRIPQAVVVNQTSNAGSITGASGTVCYNSEKIVGLSTISRGSVQWQSSTSITGPFTPIAGANTATLNTGNLTATTYFNAVVTNGVCPSKTTATATVLVRPQAISGIISGGGVSVCAGTNKTVFALSGQVGTIQWQSSTNNVDFTSIPAKTAVSFTATNLTTTTYYRVMVTNGTGCTPAFSDSVAVIVKALPVSGTITGISPISYNTATTLTVTGYEVGSSLQWRYSTLLTGTYFSGNPANSTSEVYTTSRLTRDYFYRVSVTKDGCTSTTVPFLVDVASRAKIEDLNSSSTSIPFEVKAYPNPSSSEFTIETSAKGAMSVKVYDMTGRLVESSTSSQVGSRLAAGTYNVIVNQGANTKSVRVIKK